MRSTIEFDLYTGGAVASGRRVIVPIFCPVAINSPRYKISALESSPNVGAMPLKELSSGETWHVSTTKNVAVSGDITSMVAASHIYCVSEINGATQTVTLCEPKNIPVGCAYQPLEKNPISIEKLRLTLTKGYEQRGYGHLLIAQFNESGTVINRQLVQLTQDSNAYSRVQNIIDLDIQFTVDNRTEVYFVAPSDVQMSTNTKICTLSFAIK